MKSDKLKNTKVTISKSW